MNRTERLYAIAEQLRRTGTAGVTAADLATLLEVSTRTIKRDISALQQSGLPIWAETGPSGGYFLAESASLPPINFTASQAVALSVSLAVMPPGSPFGVDGAAAARKIHDALGPRASEAAVQLAERVWVQPRESEPGGTSLQVLRAVEQSLTERRVLTMNYVRVDGDATRRTVEPIILAWANQRWYLVAHCQHRDDTRWFRLDRIERADLTKMEYVARSVNDLGVPPPTARSVAARA